MSADLEMMPEARKLWEAYAVAKQQSEDSLLSKDGLAAAQAFWAFVESFASQALGPNIVALNLERLRRDFA